MTSISSIKTTLKTMWIWTIEGQSICLDNEDFLLLEKAIKNWKKKYKEKLK